MLNHNITQRLIKIYTFSLDMGMSQNDKLRIMKDCQNDALKSGGTIISVEDKNNIVTIKAEMPMN